ncbi:MAG: serine/threonine-protein kinase, partial [Planctomycetota bacterium]
VLGRLRHPGIAQIYEAGVHADPSGAEAPFFAMEFVPGARDLLTYAGEQGLDLRARLALFAEVCDAIHHGHLQGVIHRDLKPANLLVDETGRPKVIDFGISRALAPDPDGAEVAQTLAGIGTPSYMAPEQAAGGAVDTRADVYGLGAVLYACLTGRAPFGADRFFAGPARGP